MLTSCRKVDESQSSAPVRLLTAETASGMFLVNVFRDTQYGK